MKHILNIVSQEISTLNSLIDHLKSSEQINAMEIDLALRKVNDIYNEISMLKSSDDTSLKDLGQTSDKTKEENIQKPSVKVIPETEIRVETKIESNIVEPKVKVVVEDVLTENVVELEFKTESADIIKDDTLENVEENISEQTRIQQEVETSEPAQPSIVIEEDETGIVPERVISEDSSELSDVLIEEEVFEPSQKHEVNKIQEEENISEIDNSSTLEEELEVLDSNDREQIEEKSIIPEASFIKESDDAIEMSVVDTTQNGETSVDETIMPVEEPLLDAIKTNSVIADQFQHISPSVNDMQSSIKRSKDLASQFADRPIFHLKSAVKINDRIWFVNELFNRDADSYNATLSKIDEMSNLDEALAYLFENFQWDQEKKSTISFLELVFRRFANQK